MDYIGILTTAWPHTRSLPGYLTRNDRGMVLFQPSAPNLPPASVVFNNPNNPDNPNNQEKEKEKEREEVYKNMNDLIISPVKAWQVRGDNLNNPNNP